MLAFLLSFNFLYSLPLPFFRSFLLTFYFLLSSFFLFFILFLRIFFLCLLVLSSSSYLCLLLSFFLSSFLYYFLFLSLTLYFFNSSLFLSVYKELLSLFILSPFTLSVFVFSVADPYHFDTDPGCEKFVTDPDPGRTLIRIQAKTIRIRIQLKRTKYPENL